MAQDPKGTLRDKDMSQFTIIGEEGKNYTADKKAGYAAGDFVYYKVTGPDTAEILGHVKESA